MQKRKLNNIAKRIAKTILMQSEALVMLHTTDLTEDEASYIDECLHKIGERITDKDQESDVEKIVKEEYS